MKNFLFLPILLFNLFCIAQDVKNIIGKPTKIGNIEVAENDFPKAMYWEDAKKACAKLGKGWRLPTKDELNFLYLNKDKIGGFADGIYWSSTEDNDGSAWEQDFDIGEQYNDFSKGSKFSVRAVRAF
jgi:hypothetical protein